MPHILDVLACKSRSLVSLPVALCNFVPIVLEKWDHNGDWHEALFLFSAGYLIAAVAALGINADRQIE